MATHQKFCLRWNNFQTSLTSVFDHLRQKEELVDITLCCEGKKIKAHRMMLSACSPYFRDLLKDNPCQHPLFFLKDATYSDLAAIVEFVYKGEVNVLQGQLASFLKTAETLQVKGLSGDEEEQKISRTAVQPTSAATRNCVPEQPLPTTPSAPANQPASCPRAGQPAEPPSSPRHKRRRVSAAVDSPPPAEPSTALVERASAPVKVEKEEEASLEAALDTAAMFEARPAASDPAFDGSDHSASSNDMAALLGRQVETGGVDLGGGSLAHDCGTAQGGLLVRLPMMSAEPSQAERVLCSICGRDFTPQSLNKHMQMHRGRTTCVVCGRVFGTPQSLRYHLRTQHPQLALLKR